MYEFKYDNNIIAINIEYRTIKVNDKLRDCSKINDDAWIILEKLLKNREMGEKCVEYKDLNLNEDHASTPSLSKLKKSIIKAVGLDFIDVLPKEGYRIIDENTKPIHKTIEELDNNILMLPRYKIEGTIGLTLSHRLEDASRIIMVNYAGTGFVSGVKVAEQYDDRTSSVFLNHMQKGKLKADIILTKPSSFAEKDAIKYKMNPDRLLVESKEDIIYQNLKDIFKIKKEYLSSNINVYLTEIALPYALQYVEFENVEKNYIKVDLYSPFSRDLNRPSFFISCSNSSTTDIYSHFLDVVKAIYNEAQKVNNINAVKKQMQNK